MPKYLIAALDMDGTLLTSQKTIHPDTIRDITEASEKGVHVVYCSGRAPAELQEYLSILPCMRYAICMSGALVYDLDQHKNIYTNPVSKELAIEIAKAAKEDDGMVHLLTESESIVRADQITHMADFHMGIYQTMFLNIAKTVPDIEEEIEKHDTISKINIYFHSTSARQQAYEKLKHLPLAFAFGEETSLEMTAQGVTKANGLLALASHLNVPLSQVLGIGDADNDRSVLTIVGFPIAMGNAKEEIKSICKVTTDENDHNDTGKTIRKYCLEN